MMTNNDPTNITYTNAVLDAIKSGRKIQAIKLLRQENRIGLKEAKEAIETYIEKNSEIKESFNANKSGGLSQEKVLHFCILLIVLLVVYLAF